MRDVPVVEELLEKAKMAGTYALADPAALTPEWFKTAGLGRNMQPIAALAVEAALDAVLPGWREGITREFGLVLDGDDDQEPMNVSADREETEDIKLPGDATVQRWTFRWVGQWLPVEDGTQ
jgi:hypothetical protein